MSALPSVELTAKQFASLVRPVVPLAGKDLNIPVLNAVRFEVVDQWLTAAATDRFRAGISRLKLGDAPKAPVSFTLRIPAIKQIQANFRADRFSDPSLRFEVSEKSVLVTQNGGLDFLQASFEYPTDPGTGRYPNLMKLFASEPTKSAEVVAVNGAYLASFKDAIVAGEPLEIYPGDGTKGMRIRCGDHFIGLLMPVKRQTAEAADTWPELLAGGMKQLESGPA